MTKSISILFLIFSIFLISNIETKGQPFIVIPPSYIPCNDWNVSDPTAPNCKNIGCDTPNAPWQEGFKIISLPEWPNCYFAIWFCYRVCQFGNNQATIQVQIFYWSQAVQPCVDCNNWSNWLFSDTENNSQIFSLRLWEEITLNLYQEHTDYLDSINELNLAYCPNLKTEFTATKSACKSICFYQKFDTEHNVFVQVAEEVECNQGSCCVYSRKYCVDPITHDIVIEGTQFHEDILQEIGSCDSSLQPTFSNDCYNSINHNIKPCFNKCAEPE